MSAAVTAAAAVMAFAFTVLATAVVFTFALIAVALFLAAFALTAALAFTLFAVTVAVTTAFAMTVSVAVTVAAAAFAVMAVAVPAAARGRGFDVVGEFAGDQLGDRFVGRAQVAGIKFNARFGKRLNGAASESAADHTSYTVFDKQVHRGVVAVSATLF